MMRRSRLRRRLLEPRRHRRRRHRRPLSAAATRPAAGDAQRGLEKNTVNIGKSVVIKGELNGSEDLTIEGQVEGKIELRQNILTIGPNGGSRRRCSRRPSSSSVK